MALMTLATNTWRAQVAEWWRTCPKWPALTPLLLAPPYLWVFITGSWRPYKGALERSAEFVLVQTILVAIVRGRLDRHEIWRWATLVPIVLLARELHFTGTSLGVYIAFGGAMLWIALRASEWGAEYQLRPTAALLVAAVSTYAVTYTIDQRWWRFVPYEDTFHTSLEETLEVWAHILVGLAIATLTRRRGPASGTAGASPDAGKSSPWTTESRSTSPTGS